MCATKQAAMQGLADAASEDVLAARHDPVDAMLESEHFIEGPRAFVEKRPPNWTGR